MNFALMSIPVTMAVGFAVDYASVARAGAQLQSAVDSAALIAASQSGSRDSSASAAFMAGLGAAGADTAASVTGQDTGTGYRVTGQMTIGTAVLRLVGVETFTVTRSAFAMYGSAGTAGVTDNSCIYAMGPGPSSAKTLTVGSGASVDLSGCSMRSNASMACDSRNFGATGSFAVGAVEGDCQNAMPAQAAIGDVYAGLKDKIERECGSVDGGVTWTVDGSLPAASHLVRYVARPSWIEIHICGDLTLKGKGALNGYSPAEDLVVVVENGSAIVDSYADLAAYRTTLVLAGGGKDNTFKMASGEDGATWRQSPAAGADNPWRGIAVFANPDETAGTSLTWKSGSYAAIDGVFYMPATQAVFDGSLKTGEAGCSKFALREISISGSLKLSQSDRACEALAVTQYGAPATGVRSVYLAQ